MSYEPNFTQEQKDWICYKIGDWYSHWKERLIDFKMKTHKLGHAKEQLKVLICNDLEEYIKDLTEGISSED